MVGMELVTDRQEKTPAKAETAVLFEKLRGINNSHNLMRLKSCLFFITFLRSCAMNYTPLQISSDANC